MSRHAPPGQWPPDERQELAELLADLAHDLGKHLNLPLAMLPPGAAPEEISEAFDRALRRTRHGPAGSRSARQLWGEFRQLTADRLRPLAAFTNLEEAVAKALAWEERAFRPERDLMTVRESFGQVRRAITTLLEEFQ